MLMVVIERPHQVPGWWLLVMILFWVALYNIGKAWRSSRRKRDLVRMDELFAKGTAQNNWLDYNDTMELVGLAKKHGFGWADEVERILHHNGAWELEQMRRKQWTNRS